MVKEKGNGKGKEDGRRESGACRVGVGKREREEWVGRVGGMSGKREKKEKKKKKKNII